MIEEIHIKKWEEIHELDVTNPTNFYRGQSDSSWPLESSLRRRLEGDDFLCTPDLSNRESWCFRNFKKRAPAYLERMPHDDDYIAWLSLMQHHGTPTRLLDFSHSFYVAAYFALKGGSGDSVVWSINYSGLTEIAETCFTIELEGLRDEWDDSTYQHTNELLKQELQTASPSGVKCPQGVVFVDPVFLHRRLASQRGLFLIPLDINLTFMENLDAHPERKGYPVKKIILDSAMAHKGLSHLRSMNITEETLFPGLDGLARDITDTELWV